MAFPRKQNVFLLSLVVTYGSFSNAMEQSKTVDISSAFEASPGLSTEPDKVARVLQSYGNYGQVIPSAPLLATVTNSLHECIRNGTLQNVQQLLSEGVDADEEDEKGLTPLHIAAIYNRTEIATLLLDEYDAEVNLTDDTYATTPLHLAAWQGNAEVATVLLTHNAKPNAQDGKGNTPLHVASNEQVAAIFLEHGALLTTTNNDRLQPLQAIAKACNTRVLKFLLRNNRPIEQVATPKLLLWALQEQATREVVKILINSYPQLATEKTDMQETLLHVAAQNGRRDLIKLLLAKGVDLTAVDATGSTALRKALENRHNDIAEILKAHGAQPEEVLTTKQPSPRGLLVKEREPATPVTVINESLIPVISYAHYSIEQPSERRCRLHQAVVMNELEGVKDLLAQGANRDQEDQRGWNALHIAAAYGRAEIAAFLIDELRAEVNLTEDTYYAMPLHLASWQGHAEVVQVLVTRGALIGAQDNNGNTPVHVASNVATVEVLCRNNASLDVPNKEALLPLLAHAKINNQNTFKALLIEHATYVRMFSEVFAEEPFIHWAIKQSLEKEIISMILDIFPEELNKHNRMNTETPLHLAVGLGRKDLVKLFIARGALFEEQMNNSERDTIVYNETPLTRAVRNNQQEMLELLLLKGADLSAPPNSCALALAVAQNNPRLITFLVSKGAPLEEYDISRRTALHLACSLGSFDMVQLLVNNGANINAPTRKDDRHFFAKEEAGHKTPLHLAVAAGNIEMATYLIQKGADLNACDSSDSTPLHIACSLNQKDMVKLLLKNNASTCALVGHVVTPLHRAVEEGSQDTVELLLEKGAAKDLNQASFETLISYAIGKGHTHLVTYLGKRFLSFKIGTANFYQAITTRNLDMVKSMVTLGENIHSYTNGLTPLHYAISYGGTLEIVQYLVEQGAKIEARTPKAAGLMHAGVLYEGTPLHLAAKLGHKDIVQYLLEQNANTKAKDAANRTAYELALNGNHHAVAELLKAPKKASFFTFRKPASKGDH